MSRSEPSLRDHLHSNPQRVSWRIRGQCDCDAVQDALRRPETDQRIKDVVRLTTQLRPLGDGAVRVRPKARAQQVEPFLSTLTRFFAIGSVVDVHLGKRSTPPDALRVESSDCAVRR